MNILTCYQFARDSSNKGKVRGNERSHKNTAITGSPQVTVHYESCKNASWSISLACAINGKTLDPTPLSISIQFDLSLIFICHKTELFMQFSEKQN